MAEHLIIGSSLRRIAKSRMGSPDLARSRPLPLQWHAGPISLLVDQPAEGVVDLLVGSPWGYSENVIITVTGLPQSIHHRFAAVKYT